MKYFIVEKINNRIFRMAQSLYIVLLNHNCLYSVILYDKLNLEALSYFVKEGHNSDFLSFHKT